MARRVLVMSTVTALVLAGYFAGTVTHFFTPKSTRKVAEVMERINRDFPGQVPPEQLERAAIEAMLEKTDRWGYYFTPEEWAEWSQRTLGGSFYGVGIRIASDKSGYLKVLSPMENSPALAADVLPGDLIVKVDGVDVHNKPSDDVISRIKGDVGTKVTLTLRREGKEPFDLTLTRAEIRLKNVKHRFVAPGIGYIRIEDFSESIPHDVEAAFNDLRKQELKGLVIDLRHNPGGLLKSAVQLCDLWLPDGKVVLTSLAKRDEEKIKTENPAVLQPVVPMVVLVNHGTASAAEIVAGALRDHGLATLVGARTYGKGLVQRTFELSDGSHVKLTTARWLTPSGEHVSAKDEKSEGGIHPEFTVEMTLDEEGAVWQRWAADEVLKGAPPSGPAPRDYTLEAGLEILHAKFENRPPKVEKREIPKTEDAAPK